MTENRDDHAAAVRREAAALAPRRTWKAPRGRTIEQVARIVADAEELGDREAARLHGMSAPGVAAMARKWRAHPVVAAELEARRPAIQARVQRHMRKHGAELDALLAKLTGK